MTTAGELRSLSLFEKVAEPELQQLILLGSEVDFAPGDELWTTWCASSGTRRPSSGR